MSLNPIKKIANNYIENVKKDSKNAKSYGTGLMLEHMLVSALNKFDVKDLERVRSLVSKMIKDKQRKIEIIKKDKENKKV